MRWAVRRLRGMTPQHRQLFQLHSLQRRWRRDLELIAAKRRELYGDNPWGTSLRPRP